MDPPLRPPLRPAYALKILVQDFFSWKVLTTPARHRIRVAEARLKPASAMLMAALLVCGPTRRRTRR